MCTAIISIDPTSAYPVLLCGVRDEFLGRPWEPPAQHWPGLWGGRDLRAGGTWLAVDPATPRVAALLNAFGPHVGPGRVSRGGLPLAFGPPADPSVYDPFHLIVASLDGVRMWTWDGRSLASSALGPGLHFVVNSGLEGAGPLADAPPNALADIGARLAAFRPRFAAAPRPSLHGVSTMEAWGDWVPLFGAVPPDSPSALVVRRDLGEVGIWGSNSVSLVGLRPGGVRYDFASVPLADWQRIL